MLIEILNNLANDVHTEFSSINHGGCAVFANIIATELSRLGIRVFGIVACFDVEDLNTVRENIEDNFSLEEWNQAGICFNHVGIVFWYEGKKYYYESMEGVVEAQNCYSLCGLEICEGYLYLEELEALANTKRGWNTWFNRAQIPALAEFVSDYIQKELVAA